MSALGNKMLTRAAEVQVGDFTTYSGFRRVVDIHPRRGRRVAFERVDGTLDEALYCDSDVTVYRPEVDR